MGVSINKRKGERNSKIASELGAAEACLPYVARRWALDRMRELGGGDVTKGISRGSKREKGGWP